MIKLDGSYLEGGGQIARTALALSTITQKPFELTEIRKGRPKPGLKNQHLFCVKALEKLCNAKTEGAVLGSTHLKYLPGEIKSRTISIDIGTAGSISLLLQSLLIPTLFAKVRLKITGGTDVKWSPQFDYLNNVIIPHIRKYADIEAKLLKRGYYPKGGGIVEIKIKPKFSLDTIDNAAGIDLMEQGKLIQIKGVSHASFDLQKATVAERQEKAARLILNKFGCPVQISKEYSNMSEMQSISEHAQKPKVFDTLSTGSGITVWGIFSKDPDEINFNNPVIIGADALGERGKRAEQVGKEAADKLVEEIESNAPVDSHLADNLIPFAALFGGKINTSKITNHTLTNIYVCEQFLDVKFDVDKANCIIMNKKPKIF